MLFVNIQVQTVLFTISIVFQDVFKCDFVNMKMTDKNADFELPQVNKNSDKSMKV